MVPRGCSTVTRLVTGANAGETLDISSACARAGRETNFPLRARFRSLFFLSFPFSLFGSKFFSDREFVTSSANSSNFGFLYSNPWDVRIFIKEETIRTILVNEKHGRKRKS